MTTDEYERCGEKSPGGAVECRLRKGHNPHATVRRLHSGRKANGHRFHWWEWLA